MRPVRHRRATACQQAVVRQAGEEVCDIGIDEEQVSGARPSSECARRPGAPSGRCNGRRWKPPVPCRSGGERGRRRRLGDAIDDGRDVKRANAAVLLGTVDMARLTVACTRRSSPPGPSGQGASAMKPASVMPSPPVAPPLPKRGLWRPQDGGARCRRRTPPRHRSASRVGDGYGWNPGHGGFGSVLGLGKHRKSL